MRQSSTIALGLVAAATIAGGCAADERSPARVDVSWSEDGKNAVAGPAQPNDATPVASGHDGPTTKPGGSRTTIVHLFEWRWEDIARECELVLGPKGYAAVQVSPATEHAVLAQAPWWQRYQPVSYRLGSRSGDREAFVDMVRRCADVGVEIYVDSVLNHMSVQSNGVGSAGSAHTRYDYPGLYDDGNFHGCRNKISDYNDRWQVQTCDLASQPDLATDTEYVRVQLAAHLQDLLDIGVAGVRLDGAKHMAAEDIASVIDRLNGNLFVYQEVIDFGDGAVSSSEYFATGSVTEFRYSGEITRVFRRGQLAWLNEFGTAWGFIPTDEAIVFVDNHDNQRGHGSPADVIRFTDGRLHELANAFMLAWPYGRPRVMSSYEFENGDQGPPSTNGATLPTLDDSGACTAGWVCEHRKPWTLGMVAFRNATNDAKTVENWWSDGNDQIAFSRGDRGFVVFNREEAVGLSQTLQTGMTPGQYCDALTGEPSTNGCTGQTVDVDENGYATIVLGPFDALAIHVNGKFP